MPRVPSITDLLFSDVSMPQSAAGARAEPVPVPAVENPEPAPTQGQKRPRGRPAVPRDNPPPHVKARKVPGAPEGRQATAEADPDPDAGEDGADPAPAGAIRDGMTQAEIQAFMEAFLAKEMDKFEARARKAAEKEAAAKDRFEQARALREEAAQLSGAGRALGLTLKGYGGTRRLL